MSDVVSDVRATTVRATTHRPPFGAGSLVLVAGATGTLGREVVRLLGERGVRVRTFSRDPARAQALQGVADEVVLGDGTDPVSLARACVGVDAVVSCLGAPMTVIPGGRSSFFAVDTVANRNLVAAAVGAGVSRFVYVSIFLRPAWARTRYVLAHEAVVDDLRRSGLSFGVVRPTGIFPIFDQLVDMARRGLVWIPGDGRAPTNPVHPADVAEACVTALFRDDEVDISVGGPDTMTRGEIVDLAIAAAGRGARVVHVPPPLLFALAAALRPVYPRMAEVLDFITRAFTNDFVAPRVGSRHLRNHFAGRPAAANKTWNRPHQMLTLGRYARSTTDVIA
jgi:uncharacterized protein YbjT (DUF2867 family)